MTIFDACSYIGSHPSERLAFTTVDALAKEMVRLGIQRALVSHLLAWQHAPDDGNRLLMEQIAGRPNLEPCWVVLPGEPARGVDPAAALVERLVGQGLRAVRLCPRDHVFPLVDWMAGSLLQQLSERRYLLFLDPDQVVLPTGLFDVDPTGWRTIAWLCQSYPGLSVVLTRVGYRALRVLLPLMKACPNLHLDLSYFATHQGVEEVVAQLGAGRLVFGTSQPLVDPGGAITRLAFADLDPGQRAQIANQNLERLLERVGTRSAIPPDLSAAKPAATDPLVAAAREGQNLAKAGFEIIDAHGHLGPYRNFYIPDPSAEGIVRVLDRCGVSQASLASHLAIGPDWILGNRMTAEAVAAFPGRLIGHAVANPHQPELIRAELACAFDELGLQAIKLHPDLAAHPILGEGYRPAWEFAAERGCLVLSHTYHGSRFCDPQVFGQLAERYPQVPILLVHSGALTAGFAGAIQLVKQFPNLYLDLSGSFITGAWIARMVREAGADRVIFSSDIPFIDLRYGLGRVLTAGLTEAEARLVLGGNIRRLLHLQ